MNKFVTFIFLFLISAGFVSAFSGTGDGSLGNPFNITNCTQLQEMNNDLYANYILGNNIDCSATSTWNSNTGFMPIGNNTDNFNGNLNGQNYNISGLYIRRSTTIYQGFIGYANYSGITNLGLLNVNMRRYTSDTGASVGIGGLVGRLYFCNISNIIISGTIYTNSTTGRIGSIAGWQSGSIITNITVNATITSSGEYAGGLVGLSYGGEIYDSYFVGNIYGTGIVGGIIGGVISATNLSINNSYSTGIINSTTERAGGIAGSWNSVGTVSNSYSSAQIIGYTYLGGLIGRQYNGTISESYATGSVAASGDYAGGLASYSSGIIFRSYATGNVTIILGSVYAGGLVGYQSGGTINESYATGSAGTSSTSNYAGGLAGYANGIIFNSYATGPATVAGAHSGGLVGQLGSSGKVNFSYSTGLVSGSSSTGGLIGSSTGTVSTNSYWDNQTSNKTTSAGGTGKTTAQMKTQSTFSGWNFPNIWNIYFLNNDGYPYLAWQETALQTIYLISPINNTYSNNISQNLTTYISAYYNISNATLYIYNSSNELTNETTTLYPAGTLTSNLGILVNLVDGIYNWFYSFHDSLGTLANSVNYTLIIDTLSPGILSSPDNDTSFSSSASISAVATDINNVNVFLDLDNSLVSWWRMDDLNSSGTGIADYIGDHDGTLFVNAYNSSCNPPMGQACLSFNVDSSYASAANSDDFDLGTNMTLSFWYNAYSEESPGTSSYILGRDGGGVNSGDASFIYDKDATRSGYFIFYEQLPDVNVGFPIADAPINIWHHVVFSKSGTTGSIYLNGVLKESSNSFSNNVWVNDFAINFGHPTYQFYGSMDDVMVFNRSLTSSEITALYVNSSTKYLNVTLSDLAEGTHDYKFYSQDAAGNINTTELKTFTINSSYVEDVTPLLINFTDPTPSDESTVSEIATINVSIAESSLNSVIYNWNGTNFSFYDNNLILMMDMNDYTTMDDTSKYGNDGTCSFCPTLNSSGKYGESYNFNGSSYINISDAPFNFTGNFTLSSWFNTNAIGATQQILCKAQSGGYYLLVDAGGYVVFGVHNGTVCQLPAG